MEESVQKDVRPGSARDLYEWVQAMMNTVLPFMLLCTFVFRLIGVEGTSMVPTLQPGDRLLVVGSLIDHDYQYGDILIIRKESFEKNQIVKRLIATEGQTVDIDFTSGKVYVDDVLLEEPYINELTLTNEGMSFPLTVPEGCLFVMGDNRNASTDSRDSRLGTVDARYVIGKAAVLAFPGKNTTTEQRDFSRIGFLG